LLNGLFIPFLYVLPNKSNKNLAANRWVTTTTIIKNFIWKLCFSIDWCHGSAN
jgi:hypothetical protein